MLVAGKVSVPQQKIEALQLQLCQVAKNISVPARSLACLKGKIHLYVNGNRTRCQVDDYRTTGQYALLSSGQSVGSKYSHFWMRPELKFYFGTWRYRNLMGKIFGWGHPP